MRLILVCLALFSALCFSSALFGQTASVPEDRATLFAFDSFLRHINEWQTPSASRTISSANAREHFQNAYDIEAATLDQVIKAAAAYVAAVTALDVEASTIIRAAKEKSRASGPSRGITVTPPPPELAELQKRKEALIRQTLTSIESAIGPAQLRYVGYQLRSRISVRHAGPDTAIR